MINNTIGTINNTLALIFNTPTQVDFFHMSKIVDIKKLREELDDYADTAGMHVMMQHYDIFRVTNEVTLI